jgi:hypothetical protein
MLIYSTEHVVRCEVLLQWTGGFPVWLLTPQSELPDITPQPESPDITPREVIPGLIILNLSIVHTLDLHIIEEAKQEILQSIELSNQVLPHEE